MPPNPKAIVDDAVFDESGKPTNNIPSPAPSGQRLVVERRLTLMDILAEMDEEVITTNLAVLASSVAHKHVLTFKKTAENKQMKLAALYVLGQKNMTGLLRLLDDLIEMEKRKVRGDDEEGPLKNGLGLHEVNNLLGMLCLFVPEFFQTMKETREKITRKISAS